jgi:predicted ATP-dependent protease
MDSKREFIKVTFDRKLYVKRLRAALSQTMSVVGANPSPEGAPSRVESVLMEKAKTTVVLSGNRHGLNAVASALQSSFSYAKVSKPAKKMFVILPPSSQG